MNTQHLHHWALFLGILPLAYLSGVSGSAQTTQDVVRELRWRNIGPASPMGRIASIDALHVDYRTVLVASASGGVFKSLNGGITWKSIFDHYGSGSIGSAVFFQPDPNIIWVGTGEAANRNSSGWGDGVYKSLDGGLTFRNMGLENTHHIAEIAVHPSDPNVVYVAAVGHLWGYSGDRGIFKTEDGGESWVKLGGGLPDDGKTGGTEILVHPEDPRILFAGLYHRIRQPASFHSGGPNGGLYKSLDGGTTWRKLTKGLPVGDTGQIDIAIHRKDPNILVANIEADQKLPDDLTVPGPGVYRSDDCGESWRYLLRHNTRPFYHGQIDIDPEDDQLIYVVSRDFRVSKDGGKTFGTKWWGGGGDDHDMWISPKDSNVFYLATDQGAYLTVDGGRTVLGFNNIAISQYYAIGADMRDPYWVMGGLQDCGLWISPSNSREPRGILDAHSTWVGEGDGFHSQIDPTDWRTLYMVNHVGFAARLNLETREHSFITPNPETLVNFSEFADSGFDETPTRYTISPGEHWFFGENPRRPILPPQFRFNWSSPLILSPSNPRTVYFAGNHLFRSVDRGETWRIISPDLTTNDPALRNPSTQGGLTNSVTGGENHCTIITIAESPVDPAVLFVGTDDGNIQVSRDGGAHWTNVREKIPGLPERVWVSRLEASHFEAGRVYLTLDNHRHDDHGAYVFVSENYGESWRNISNGLPKEGSAYVIREDPINPRLLFLGTEFAVFCSIDRGESWVRIEGGLPTVAIHDLIIHPRDSDLIAGTHGRSIWILDDITALQQLNEKVLESELHIFEPRTATKWQRINLGRKQPDFMFRGKNPPRGASLHFWVALREGGKGRGPAEIEIAEPLGNRSWKKTVEVHEGLNQVRWDLIFPPTNQELASARTHLVGVIEALKGVVKESLEGTLESLRDRLGEESEIPSAGRLNRVRSELVKDFAVYAKGRPLFGSPVGQVSAPPGDYRVSVRLGDLEMSTRLRVREDPILKKDDFR